MLSKIRPRLTYANVMATLAVFMVLGGGAYAATQLPKNSVGTKQLKRNSVVSGKVRNGTLRRADFAGRQLPVETRGREGGTFCTDDDHENPGESCGEVQATFPRNGRALVVATATAFSTSLDDTSGPGSSTDSIGMTEAWCRLFLDGTSVSSQVTVSGFHPDQYVPFALTAVPAVSQGAHAFELICKEADGDVNVRDVQLSVVMMGDG